jgi:beta-lactamase class A
MSGSFHRITRWSLLQRDLEALAANCSGQLGVCALIETERGPIGVRENEAFPLQSVMKLVVGAAVLDAVDRRELGLGDEINVKPDDISPGPQEFSKLVRRQGGYTATVEELVRRSIIASDSTSVDLLLKCCGGIAAVQSFIKRKMIFGIRIDRTERDLQTESVGLTWKAEYSDLERFDDAVRALPPEQRSQSWITNASDARDKATPRGIVEFLRSLIKGQLLSPTTTEKLLNIMAQTATGKDRLRAGMPSEWNIAHKTGTGWTWQGETETTNDVGILTAPDGTRIAVAVFLARSNASAEDQANTIARVASLLCASYSGGGGARAAASFCR